MTITQITISPMHRREPCGTACLLFVFSFLFFHVFRISVPLNVDTFLYARAVETFEGPIIHFGYYLLGALCHAFLKPVGVTPLETLGYISQFFGGISVAGMYLLTFLLTGNRLHSLLSALILMFSGAVWAYSIHGEVYVPQLAFVLLSLICLLKTRPLWSGIFILVAIAITPTSLLALIPACCILYMRHPGRKDLIAFASPVLIASAVVMWWDGPRIIEAFSGAIYPPTLFVEPFSYTKLLTLLAYHLMRAYGNSFNIICVLAVFGFFLLYPQNRKLWGLMLAFILPFSAYFFNLGLFSDDHLILSFVAVSFLGAYGMLRLLDKIHAGSRTRIVFVTLFVCFHCLVTYERSISRQRAYAAELGRVVHALSEKYPPNGILLTDFDFGVIFFSSMGKDYPFALLKGNPNKFLMNKDSNAKAEMARLQGKFWVEFAHLLDVAAWPGFETLVDDRPIYFADRSFWPIGMIQAYMAVRDTFGIEDTTETGRLEKIREFLAYRLDTNVTVEKIIDSPLYPVSVMRPVSESARQFWVK